MNSLRFGVFPVVLTLIVLFGVGPVAAQTQGQAADQTASTADSSGDQSPPLSEAQLEQLVAPIALYPDALLAQVMMASTYPLEVVSAARWVAENPNLKGDDMDKALAQQNWDASVKSLVAFPAVLQMMNDKVDWTEQLGDAFLAQQAQVMNAVQVLRNRAQAAGTLESGPQQKVTVTPAAPAPSAGGEAPRETIIIEPAQPDVVYVPTYNPTVVYGTWPYPEYPPYGWSTGAMVVSNLLSFGLGYAIGHNFWGDCDWHGGSVNVNVNNFNNFNNRFVNYHPQGGAVINHNKIINGQTAWTHNPDHRRGVPYRDQAVNRKFTGGRSEQAREQAREQFRGHADKERAGLAGLDRSKLPSGGQALKDRAGQVARPGAHGGGERLAHSGGGSAGRAANLPRQGGHGQTLGGRTTGGAGHAFSHVNTGGQAWQDRDRGAVSRQHLAGHGDNLAALRGGGHGGGFGGHGGGFGGHGGGVLRRR